MSLAKDRALQEREVRVALLVQGEPMCWSWQGCWERCLGWALRAKPSVGLEVTQQPVLL